MDLASYLIYLSISIFASASIGPSVVLAATNGMHFGRRKALLGVLGHVSAIFILALVSASGVGALILASENLFLLVKYLGVVYLAYIGWAIWKSKGSWSFTVKDGKLPSGFSLYRKSLLLGLSNPKALVFFTSLFPQFLNPEAPLAPQFLMLASTSLVNAFAFTFGYALLAHHLKNRALPLINNGWLGKITGAIFVSFAGVLAVAR